MPRCNDSPCSSGLMSVRRDSVNIPELVDHDSYDFTKAKHSASILWLVSKASREQVPANLLNPYYHDQNQGVDRLKPHLVCSLANGELYCSCLVNIYADPNYHNLTHWGVIQTLARRGVYVTEPKDVSLTETVLLQTSPLRMSAHMAVIEALMALYVREVVTAERAVAVVRRFSSLQPSSELPADQSQALLLWLNKSCSALRLAVAASFSAEFTHARHQQQQQDILPEFPLLQEMTDLCDGVCLAGLVAFYAPGVFDWSDIAFSQPARLSDSLHNIALVQHFCANALPRDPFFLTPEDLLYTDSSIIPNILVFLADLFYLFEVKPAKCVRVPINSNQSAFRLRRQSSLRSDDRMSAGRPDLSARANSNSPVFDGYENNAGGGSFSTCSTAGVSPHKQCSVAADGENDFVVQRANVRPTLSRMTTHGRSDPARADLARNTPPSESGRLAEQSPAAGKPSVGAAGTGRRSRRSSISDESQLTLENFGGSQENLHLLSRNPDKQPAVLTHQGCRANGSAIRQDLLKHSSISFEGGQEDGGVWRSVSRQELDATDLPRPGSVSRSSPESGLAQIPADTGDNLVIMFDTNEPCDAADVATTFQGQHRPTSSFAQLSRGVAHSVESGASTPSGIKIFYTPQQQKQRRMTDYRMQDGSCHEQPPRPPSIDEVKLKLEEKRRFIENEKKRMGNSLDNHKQVFGKQAFFQAVVKNNDVGADQKWTRCPPVDDKIAAENVDNTDYDYYQNSLQTHPLSELSENIEGLSQQRELVHVQHHPRYQLNQQMQPIAIENGRMAQMTQSVSAPSVYKPTYGGAYHCSGVDSTGRLIPSGFLDQSQFFLHSQRVGALPARRQWMQPSGPAAPPAEVYSQSGPVAPGSTIGHFLYTPAAPPVQSRARWSHPDRHRQYQGHVYEDEVSPTYVSSAGFDQFVPADYPPVHQAPVAHVPNYAGNFNRGEYYRPVAPPESINSEQVQQPRPHSSRQPRRHSVDDSSDPRRSPVLHAPLPVPSLDDMKPQNVCFISDACSRLDAVSLDEDNPANCSREEPGSLRLSSNPDSTSVPAQAQPDPADTTPLSNVKVDRLKNGSANSELGFVISFDSDYVPRKSKPKLGSKRNNTSFKSSLSSETKSSQKSKSDYQNADSNGVSSVIPSSGSPSAFSTYTRSSSRQACSDGSPQRFSLSTRHSSPLSSADPACNGADQQAVIGKFEVDEIVRLEEMKPISHDLSSAVGVVIGDQLANPSAEVLDDMERKRERILKMSLKRKENSEAARREKEEEVLKRKEVEALKEEEKQRKKEEERARKERIFEQYKLKKAIEEAEKNGTAPPVIPPHLAAGLGLSVPAAASTPRSRVRAASVRQARPRSAVEPSGPHDRGTAISAGRSTSNLQAVTEKNGLARWDSQSSVASDYPRARSSSNSSLVTDGRGDRPMSSHSGRKPPVDRMNSVGRTMRKGESHRTSTGSLSCQRTRSRLGSRTASSSSLFDSSDVGRRGAPSVHSGRRVSNMDREVNRTFSKASVKPQCVQHRSVTNVFGSTGIPRYGHSDSGLGDSPLRRGISPAGSVSGLSYSRRRMDDFSDVSSVTSGDYNGPRLFKQPASKSNRSMMLNAVEYCVFPGAVNREAKRRVLEEIAASDAKHFLILFRDGRCQFRALYWYEPETDEIVKLYGTGPRQINDRMFDRFFKYNSGGKCFSQIHTKHLSATIDAFTIQDSLWQGKRPSLYQKRDSSLVV